MEEPTSVTRSSSASIASERVFSVTEVAARLGATLLGEAPDCLVTGVADPGDASASDLVFLVEPKYLEQIRASAARVVVASAPIEGRCVLQVADPRLAMARALALFQFPLPRPAVHPGAWIDLTSQLGDEVHVGAGVVVGAHVQVGARTVLMAGTVLGDGVVVGEDCLLHPRVVVEAGCRLGDRVVLQAGVVIGSDGYGFVRLPDGRQEKMPQIGIVEIGDDVEIGANCAIDRATLGVTRIGAGTKIDNLVHVGHNVQVGRDALLVAQVGISGSTRIGDRVVLAGQVGVAGHLQIASDIVVAARGAVTKSLREPGMYSGFPARPHRENLKREASVEAIPGLKARLVRLEGRLSGESNGSGDRH